MVGKENIQLVNFIEAFLKTPIVDRKGKSYTCQERGIPQGSPISPVLIHFYLHILDAELERVMAREDGTVVFSYARYADDMVFGLARGDKSTRVTRGLKKVLARVLRELQLGFTSTEISRKQPGRLQIIGLPLSLKSEGQLHVGIPSKRREKQY